MSKSNLYSAPYCKLFHIDTSGFQQLGFETGTSDGDDDLKTIRTS